MTTRIIASGVEPVSLEEALTYLRQDSDNVPTGSVSESQLMDMITAAREMVEKEINYSLTNGIVEFVFSYNDIDENGLYLPLAPIQDINSVEKYLSGVSESLKENTDYIISGLFERKIVLNSVPISLTSEVPEYKVTYTTGTGAIDETMTIDRTLKIAVLLIISDLYKSDGFMATIPGRVKAMINKYTNLNSPA